MDTMDAFEKLKLLARGKQAQQERAAFEGLKALAAKGSGSNKSNQPAAQGLSSRTTVLPVKSSASGGLYLGTPFDRVREVANMFAPKSQGTMTGAYGAEIDLDYGRSAAGKTDDDALERLKGERDAARKAYQAANTKRYGVAQAAKRGRNPEARGNMAAAEEELDRAEEAYNKALAAYNSAIRENDFYNRSKRVMNLESVQYTDTASFKALAEQGKRENPSLFNYKPTEGRILSSRGQRTRSAPDGYYMSDAEKDVYAYWLVKDKSRAKEYKDSLSTALNYRRQADESKRIQKVSEQAPVLGAAVGVLGSFAAPASLVGTIAHNVGDLVMGEETPMDSNSWVHSGTHLVSDSLEGAKRNVKTPFGEFLIDTGFSLLQFASKLPLGPAALPMMASGAGGQAALEVTERGGTAQQALKMGLVAAAAEYFTEKISLDSLMKIYKAGGAGFKTALKTTAANMGRQMVTEASEEMLSEYVNTVGDEMIMGDMSSMNLYVQELVAGGMTEEEAIRAAVKQFWIVNPLMAAAGGALSGGVMGGFGSAAGQVRQSKADGQVGAELSRMAGGELDAVIDELIATGREFGQDTAAGYYAEKAADKLAIGRSISANEMGRLWRSNAQAQEEQAAAYFNGEAPVNPAASGLPTAAEINGYALKKQQYAYAVKLAETLRQYGVKDVVIEDMPEGINGRWENGTVYVSSSLDTARAINAKVAHEISHAAKEGDAAFSADITQAMAESGIDVEAAIQRKLALYSEFFRKQGKSDAWIEKNITEEYAADEVAADYIGELMRDDRALNSLRRSPGLAGRLLKAVNRLLGRTASLPEQAEYARLASRLREIAGAEPVSQDRAVSGDGTRYSADEYEPEIASIKEQIEYSRDMLNNMSPVANKAVPTNLVGKKAATKWAIELLSDTGYRVDRQGFGTIYFNKKDINNGMNYADTPAEKAALAVLPQVLKRGVEIGRHEQHKGRKKKTVTFGAPVVINGSRGNMAVVVNLNGNHYYTHRIVLPDGTAFVFSEENANDAVQEPHRGVAKNGSLADATSTASKDIISDAEGKSNNNLDDVETVRYDFENILTAEVLERNINEAASMGPVANVDMGRFQKGEIDLVTQVERFFDQIGNRAVNPEIGEVLMDRRGAKSDIAHGIGRKKAASFAAVPDVIERGKVVDYQRDWKGRGYDSAVIAAPVTIDEEIYIEGVVVTRNEGENRFYLHEVFIEKEDTLPFKTGTSQMVSTPGGKASSLYILLKKVSDVKRNLADDVGRRLSLDDELTGEGGEDIIGDTDSAIETVRRMHREGRTPNEIYNATGKAVMANGDIFSGIGGKKEGNVNDYAEADQRRPGLDDEPLQSKQSVRESNEYDGRRDGAGSRENPQKRSRTAWGELGPGQRGKIADIVKRYIRNPNEELSLFIDSFGGKNGFAEVIYKDYFQGDLIVERWAHSIPQFNEMLREFDEISGDGKTRYSVEEDGEAKAIQAENAQEETVQAEAESESLLDGAPQKAVKHIDRADNITVRELRKILSVSGLADKGFLKPVVSKLSSEYIETGSISQDNLEECFKAAWDEGKIINKDFSEKYKDLKEELKTKAVSISAEYAVEITDFNNWLKRNSENIIVSGGGTPVDVRYQELRSTYGDIFPAWIDRPDAQLRRMAKVSKDISAAEQNIVRRAGEDAGVLEKDAHYEFVRLADELQRKLKTTRGYLERIRAEKAERQRLNELGRSSMDAGNLVAVKGIYRDMKEQRRLVEKAVADNLLSESDNNLIKRMLRGELTAEELPDGSNKAGIKAVFEAKREYERLAKSIREFNQNRKAALRDEADKFLTDARNWKDKSAGWKYSRETMERNIRDIAPDKATAEAVIKRYIAPVHKHEADRNRLKNLYRSRVKALELDTKPHKGDELSEAAAVQILGEAEDNIDVLQSQRARKAGDDWRNGHTLTEWKSIKEDVLLNNPSLDMAKIRGAVAEFRSIYNELFEMMNEARIRNGYEPVDYRRGYFPHFRNEQNDSILAKFGLALGIQMDSVELPTSINGLTHTFRPGIRWTPNILSRKGFETIYDAVEGFDRYIEGVSDVICHTEDIQALRAFAEQARYRTGDEGIRKQVDEVRADKELSIFEKEARIKEIYEKGKFELSNFVVNLEEYTNLLANKKAFSDRNMERAFGRKAYKVVQALENRVAANMVAVNPGSWLTNFIPISQGGAQLKTKNLVRGMWETLKAYKSDDGFASASTFLTNRRGSDPLVKTWTQKASGILSTPMEFIDQFTADSLVRGRYYDNLEKKKGKNKETSEGMSEAEALDEADSWAAGVMADRSKGSLPTLFESKNPLTKIFTQFQLEVNNQLSYLFKDLPREQREKGLASLMAALLKFFFGAWMYNEVYEYFIGRRPALDPIGILNDTAGDLTGYRLPNVLELAGDLVSGRGADFTAKKETLAGAGAKLAENVAEELPFVGGLMGGGRLPISSAIPDVGSIGKATANLISGEGNARKNWSTIGKELINPAAYLAPPFGGGQLKKLYQGIKTTLEHGKYTVDGEGNDILQYPVYNDNPAKTALNYVQAGIFGPTALEGGQDWIEGGFKSRSASETAVYQELVKIGTPERLAYETIVALSKAEMRDKGTENEVSRKQVQYEILMGSELKPLELDAVYYGLLATDREKEMMEELDGLKVKYGESSKVLGLLNGVKSTDEESAAYQKRKILLASGLNDEQKEAVYIEFVSSSDATMEKMAACEEAGLGFDGFLEISNTFDKLDNDASQKAAQKAAGFITELSTAGYDAEQISTIGEKFLFRTSMSSTGALERFKEITASGVSAEAATDVLMAVTGLEPPVGQEQVTEAQKLNAISGLSISEEEKLAAAGAVVTDSTVKKLGIGSKFGITVGSYAEFRETLPLYDANGNGSYTQSEVAEALRSMSGLTADQKAVLWQLANTSWKPYKNPFGSAVGAQVKAELEAATEVSGGGAVNPAFERLKALARGETVQSTDEGISESSTVMSAFERLKALAGR